MRTSPELIVSACQAPRAPRHRLSVPRLPATASSASLGLPGLFRLPATGPSVRLPRRLRHGCLVKLGSPRAPLGLPSGSPATVAPPRWLRHGDPRALLGPGSRVWRHETLGSGPVFSSCWIFHLCLKPFHHGFRVRSLTLTSDQAPRPPRLARHCHGTLGHCHGTLGHGPRHARHGPRRLCHGCLPRHPRLPLAHQPR